MVSIEDPKKSGKMPDEFVEKHPELFPDGIRNGYGLKEVRRPKKPGVPTRRITVDSVAYTVRPSFAMAYHTAFADDVEKALFPWKVNAPFWAMTYVFGRNNTYWHRMEQSLGRNSVVGTTVKSPGLLPENLPADEKHSRLKGEKVRVPATPSAAGAYWELPQARTPERRAWRKAAACSRRKPWTWTLDTWTRSEIRGHGRVESHHERMERPVSDDLRRLPLPARVHKDPRSDKQEIQRAFQNSGGQDMELLRGRFEGLLFPTGAQALRTGPGGRDSGGHRTGNMIDRLMQRMDRHPGSTFCFHGSLAAAESGVRVRALVHTFATCTPWTVREHDDWKSPAEWLNKTRYHENWL